MSTLENSQALWSQMPREKIDPRYEKCRNIAEEIYKRINITFEIKKLETAQSELSDNSDQIDSNELSNETDLFACDKSDITSSTEADRPATTCEKYININNNEEIKKKFEVAVCKRPRKRFRKRVKKSQSKRERSDTDGSSDEALPLSRMVDVDAKSVRSEGSPDNVMGVPKIVIVTKDFKPKILSPDQKSRKKDTYEIQKPSPKPKIKEPKPEIAQNVDHLKSLEDITKAIDKTVGGRELSMLKEEKIEIKICTLCSLSCRGERGLRRHMSMSHVVDPEYKRQGKSELDVKN